MNVIAQIVTNKCIYVPFAIWILIQCYKVFSELITTRKFNFKRILGAGGMPSSHAAVVCSLAILVGREQGFNSPLFAACTIFAFVVMYDAAGVRRAAGKQAVILNKLINSPGIKTNEVQEKLVELLGHTPFQVAVGAAIGIIGGAIF